MARSSTDLRAPIFTGVNYEFWCIRMKTIFKSHNLWSFVEDGFTLSKEVNETNEKQILADQNCHIPDRLRRSTILFALDHALMVLFLETHTRTS
ncbi:hypothetical protein ACFX1X_032369 [Malus domestica]